MSLKRSIGVEDLALVPLQTRHGSGVRQESHLEHLFDLGGDGVNRGQGLEAAVGVVEVEDCVDGGG